MKVEMNFSGFDELQAKLLNLTRTEQSGVFRKAVRNSQKLMQKAAKASALSMVGGDLGQKLSANILVRKFKKRRKGQYGVSVLISPIQSEGWFVHETQDSPPIRYWIPAAVEYGHVLAPWGHSPRKFYGLSAREYKRMSGESKQRQYGMRFVKPIPFMRTASDNTTQSRFRYFEALVNKYIIDLWTSKVVASKPAGYFDSDED